MVQFGGYKEPEMTRFQVSIQSGLRQIYWMVRIEGLKENYNKNKFPIQMHTRKESSLHTP